MNSDQSQILYDSSEVLQMIQNQAREMVRRHPDASELALVGIRTGGAHLAKRLQNVIYEYTGQKPLLGVIDITLYRDDWTRLHQRPMVGKTEIDFNMDGAPVVLVDDVLYTGRTIRAALDALIDFGRPRFIELAVLIDRGWRELPIQADYVCAVLETTRDQAIDVLLSEAGASKDQVIKRLS